MSIEVVGKRAGLALSRMLEREVPSVIVFTREFNPSTNTLRLLAHMLVATPEIVHLTGEVSKRGWWGLSRVLLTVAQLRRKPIGVDLRTVFFSISRRRRDNYRRCLAEVAIDDSYRHWRVVSYRVK